MRCADLERTFDNCAEIVQDLSLAAVRRWKNEHPGAKAIGYFPVYALFCTNFAAV